MQGFDPATHGNTTRSEILQAPRVWQNGTSLEVRWTQLADSSDSLEGYIVRWKAANGSLFQDSPLLVKTENTGVIHQMDIGSQNIQVRQ